MHQYKIKSARLTTREYDHEFYCNLLVYPLDVVTHHLEAHVASLYYQQQTLDVVLEVAKMLDPQSRKNEQETLSNKAQHTELFFVHQAARNY
ncbi:hypothetical protein GIB67_010487, partial [Kingdonia uniflora]